MALTGDIENYPGFDQGVDGLTLGMKMQAGAERFGARSEYGDVSAVELGVDIKMVHTDVATYSARTVVIATGADPRELGLPGERELVGRGVHYCAHCDGRFYKGKTVIVVGGGNSAAADALYLSRLAERVILVHRRDTLRATKIYHEPLMKADNIEFRWNSTLSELIVDGRVTGAVLTNVKTGDTEAVDCHGVFVSIGRKPNTALFKDQLSLDENGYIIADESTRTSLRGVFAAGDVRAKALRQVITAASDGAVAAHYAEEYLSALK